MIALGFGILLVLTGALGGLAWSVCRLYVPEDKCAVLTRKTGTELPAGQIIATEPRQKGIQEQVLGPGRHWLLPLRWEVRLVDLTVIPSGKPETWEWSHSLSAAQRDQLRDGTFKFEGKFPMIGIVTRKVGPRSDEIIVDRASKKQGILREVLSPGTYKINPEVFDVQLSEATVIPAGFVGVVTNMFGDSPPRAAGFSLREDTAPAKAAPPAQDEPGAEEKGDNTGEEEYRYLSSLAEPGQRGVLRDVLQPGVYFINPKLQRVTLLEIGYNEYSQIKVSEADNLRIAFPSNTGYTIRVGVTVVWGIHPRHAPQIISEFGNIDRVLDKIIGPQLRSICRNIGSTYDARDFIQGEKRELFQQDLTSELHRVCGQKNVDILLALVREIEVQAPNAGPDAGDVTEDLKRTIQQSFVAIEKQITKQKQREAATVKAKLEEEQKKIDIVRETVVADTRVMVANIGAEAEKEAAEIDAQAQLEVATTQQQVAELDALRIEILGQAKADVEKMKKESEAKGYRMLIDAFGSPAAYNLYTFAENFEPQSIRLFFAGEGTFWTDLTRFEEAGAARLLQPTADSTSGP